jgi:hypothetical protein
MDAAKPLNYDPKPRALARTWRRVYGVVLILGIVAAAFCWGPATWNRTNSFIGQYQAAHYLRPPSHIAYEETPKGVISADRSFGSLTGLVFLDGLRRPDGIRRLVRVDVDDRRPGIHPLPPELLDYGLTYTVAPLFEWRNNGYALVQRSQWETGVSERSCKFFAGQPDPANLSHFTFDFEADGTHHTCDAWLDNDDKLLISQRP